MTAMTKAQRASFVRNRERYARATSAMERIAIDNEFIGVGAINAISMPAGLLARTDAGRIALTEHEAERSAQSSLDRIALIRRGES